MKKVFIILFAGGLTLASCKKLTDLNEDTKSAKNGEAPSETLFANATKNLVDQTVTPSVNLNILRTISEFWTETTYTDESNFNLTTRRIPDFEFQIIYRDVLNDFKEAKRLIELESDVHGTPAARKNKIAITEILSVYAFVRQVDIFGNVPYSEALDIDNVLPKYDDAKATYAALFTRLDAAIASIDDQEGAFSNGFDVIYSDGDGNSDMKKWKEFANSLKLKMAITVADVSELNPNQKASEALAGGVLSSAANSARYQYLGASPNTNPINAQLVLSGRQDWVVSNTLVDIMLERNDPRIDNYCDDNLVVKGSNGQDSVVFEGGIFGASNDYEAYSQVTTMITSPTWKGNLLDYSEVQFYLAEAAERGFIAGSAENYYNEGVRSSILFWGGTAQEANAYLLNPKVAYATAGADYKEKIGTQAWLAAYDRPDAAWNTYRRLDYPALKKPAKSNEDVPKRYTYPVSEQTLNGANYSAAVAAMGGDTKATKLFWDKN